MSTHSTSGSPQIALVLALAGLVYTTTLKAQQDAPDPDFLLQQDPKTSLWGVVDANDHALWPAEFTSLRPAGKKVAVGFKPGDGDAYILGTGGRVKRVPHADYWRTYKEALLRSDIADRQLIARVLDMYADPLARLAELENMERTYAGMGEVREEAVGKLLAQN